MKKANKNSSLIDCSLHQLGIPNQQNSACSLKIDQNILTRFNIQSTFELFSNIECHILKLTFFMHFKLQRIVDWRDQHVCDDFDRRVPLQTRPFLWVADFDRPLNDENTNESIDETYVGKSGPTTAPVGSQSKNLATRQLICAQMVAQEQLCSPSCCSGSLEPEYSCHDRDWIMELPMEADILTFTGILTPEDASIASCFPFDIAISLSWSPLLSIPPLHSAIP